MIFAGGDNCYRVLKREPMLRIADLHLAEAPAHARDEVVATLRAFHSLWSGAAPQMIRNVDRAAAHGNFHNWVTITKHMLNGMQKKGLTEIDEDLVHWTYSKLSGM